MTQIEKEALVLFKDYTHLQLKSFWAKAYKDKEEFRYNDMLTKNEQEILDKALDYWRAYTSMKLKQNKK